MAIITDATNNTKATKIYLNNGTATKTEVYCVMLEDTPIWASAHPLTLTGNTTKAKISPFAGKNILKRVDSKNPDSAAYLGNGVEYPTLTYSTSTDEFGSVQHELKCQVFYGDKLEFISDRDLDAMYHLPNAVRGKTIEITEDSPCYHDESGNAFFTFNEFEPYLFHPPTVSNVNARYSEAGTKYTISLSATVKSNTGTTYVRWAYRTLPTAKWTPIGTRTKVTSSSSVSASAEILGLKSVVYYCLLVTPYENDTNFLLEPFYMAQGNVTLGLA